MNDDQANRHQATMAFFESVKVLADEIEGEKAERQLMEEEWRSRCVPQRVDDE